MAGENGIPQNSLGKTIISLITKCMFLGLRAIFRHTQMKILSRFVQKTVLGSAVGNDEIHDTTMLIPSPEVGTSTLATSHLILWLYYKLLVTWHSHARPWIHPGPAAGDGLILGLPIWVSRRDGTGWQRPETPQEPPLGIWEIR